MSKKYGILSAVILFIFCSCSNFIPFQDLQTLNELYTTSASIESHQITSFTVADKNGTLCIPSGTQTTVHFSIINPYPHVLAMTASSASVFTQPPVMGHIGSDLTQAELVFALDPSEELKTIDFTVTAMSEDGLRTFGTYNFSVFCNSMPSEVNLQGKAFSTGLNACILYGNLPSQASDIDIESAEISYYTAGTTSLAGTASINPNNAEYKVRPSGVPDSFVHTDKSFYYYVPGSALDYDWGITLVDSAGLRSAAVYTTPLILSELPAVTAGEPSGTYYTTNTVDGYDVVFTSSTEASVIEYRTKSEGGEYSSWASSGGVSYTHSFPVGVTTIQVRAYKQMYPYSPVAEFVYTIIPQTVAGFTIPAIADNDVVITLEAQNPLDSSVIPLSDGSYRIPTSLNGIRITAAVAPAGTYTYTWILYSADGSEFDFAANPPAASTALADGIQYTSLPSGFYTLIVVAEDAGGNAGMEFVPLYTAY